MAVRPDTAGGIPASENLVAVPPGFRLRGRHFGLKVVVAAILTTIVVIALGALLAFRFGLLDAEPEAVDPEDLFVDASPEPIGGSSSGNPDASNTPEDSGAEPGSGGATSAGESGGQGGGSSASGTGGSLVPAAGVYEYATTGYMETVIFGSRDRTAFPSSVPAVVSVSGNCWVWDVRFFQEYTHKSTVCDQAGVIVSTRTEIHNGMEVVALDSVTTCTSQPPMGGPALQGSTWPIECTAPTELVGLGVKGGTQRAKGTATLVGVETVQVGAASVQAWHTRQDTTQTGVGEGTSVVDYWISTSNGMIVRYSIDYQVRNAWATVGLRQDMTLRSTVPRS